MTGRRTLEVYGVEADLRMTVVIRTVGALGLIVHVALIPFFIWLGVPVLAGFNVASSAAWIAGLIANRRGDHDTAVSLMTLEVVAHTILAVAVLGWQAGFQYYLLGGIPFTLLNTRFRAPQIVALALIITVTFCLLYLLVPSVAFVFPDPWLARALHVANAAIAFAAIGLASFHFRHASLAAEKELEHQASTDALTGLNNRRRMLELLDQEHARARRTGRPVAILIADVDHFKQFNDVYGHECGDQVLVETARVLDGRLRQTDVLGRWGGEEFLAILAETEVDGARRIAEALRTAVGGHKVVYQGKHLTVTLTVGIAVSDGRETMDATIARADAALYEGKEDGRNRVVVAGPAEPAV